MSGELERGLLGALALRPALLEDSDLRDHDFPAGRFRETFQAIVTMWEESRPAEVDPVILAERVGGNGAGTFIASLLDGNVRLSPEAFLGRVSELRKRALTSRVLARIEEQAKCGKLDLDEIRGDLEAYDGLQGKGFDPGKVLMTGAQIQALDIKVAWIIDRLIPERSLTVLHGPGGLGKSWLCLALAKAVSEGLPFLGLPTKQCPVVYIDFENPWPVHKERVDKMNLRDNYRAWHLSFDPRPPKLDGPDWLFYKSLPPGSLMFIDTCRACHDGKENDSDVAALVMGRLKQIRELDHHIILLHHTPRANDRASKGSTAWTDLADQTLAFYRNKRGTFEEIEEEGFDPNALLFFGTGDKSRYERSRFCVTFNPITGEFAMAEDPGAKAIDALGDYITGDGHGKNQTAIIDWAMDEHVGTGTRKGIRLLLDRGENEGRWHTESGLNRSKLYYPGGRSK